jgi:hypothetical protein
MIMKALKIVVWVAAGLYLGALLTALVMKEGAVYDILLWMGIAILMVNKNMDLH